MILLHLQMELFSPIIIFSNILCVKIEKKPTNFCMHFRVITLKYTNYFLYYFQLTLLDFKACNHAIYKKL